MRRTISTVLLIGLTAGLWTARAQAAPASPGHVPDEVVVQYRAGTTDTEHQRARGRVRGAAKDIIRKAEHGSGLLEVVRLPAQANVRAVAALLKGDPTVAFAEPNFLYSTDPTMARTPNDPTFDVGYMWGMYGDGNMLPNYNPAVESPEYHIGGNAYGSQANEAWAAYPTPYRGNKNIFVGVIDSGIDYNHEDLGRYSYSDGGKTPGNVGNPREIPNNRKDDDRNGYVDDWCGWNFSAGSNRCYVAGDDESHGTHVAGTIGALGNNGKGVIGVNWNVGIISAKFFGSGWYGNGSLSSAVKAMDYFTNLKQRGLNIVATNNSWGCYCYSQALHDAVIRAAKVGILTIAAAGNDGINMDEEKKDENGNIVYNRFYPAAYDTTQGTSTQSPADYDGVISVASINEKGARAGTSNYGAISVDIGAPGVSIVSTTPNNTYSYKSGTSMATPHVAGAAALYESAHPRAVASDQQLAAANVKEVLLLKEKGGHPTNSLSGTTTTGNRLDISCVLKTRVRSNKGYTVDTCRQDLYP